MYPSHRKTNDTSLIKPPEPTLSGGPGNKERGGDKTNRTYIYTKQLQLTLTAAPHGWACESLPRDSV